MSTDIAADVSFWEKLGDGLSAFSEGLGSFILRLMGSSNERYVRKLGYVRASKPGATHTVIPGSLLAQVNELEDQMRALSDDEMKGLAAKWRGQLAQGGNADRLAGSQSITCTGSLAVDPDLPSTQQLFEPAMAERRIMPPEPAVEAEAAVLGCDSDGFCHCADTAARWRILSQ